MLVPWGLATLLCPRAIGLWLPGDRGSVGSFLVCLDPGLAPRAEGVLNG